MLYARRLQGRLGVAVDGGIGVRLGNADINRRHIAAHRRSCQAKSRIRMTPLLLVCTSKRPVARMRSDSLAYPYVRWSKSG
jgi:hypothetical protein